MVYLTRIERFNAAHRLYVNEWSEEKNREVFGKCCNKNWHGHNYSLHVTVCGNPDPLTGFVMDVRTLADIIKEHVIEFLDHNNLNLDVPFIPSDMMPTTENLCIVIFNQLKPHIEGARLYAVRLHETETIYAEYRGES